MNGEDDSRDKRSELGHLTVFHEFRDAKLDPMEKDPKRLTGEASVFMGAGTETTARTLAVGIYYLIKNESSGQTLREELRCLMKINDTRVSLPQLEALPYLVSYP